MADLSTAISDYLSADSNVSSSVNTIRSDELYETDTLPAVLFWRVSGTHINDINGSFGGICHARITTEAYSETGRASANQIAEYVRLAMINFRGTRSGVQVRDCTIDESQQHYTVRPTDGNAGLRYVTAQDFRITFVEATS